MEFRVGDFVRSEGQMGIVIGIGSCRSLEGELPIYEIYNLENETTYGCLEGQIEDLSTEDKIEMLRIYGLLPELTIIDAIEIARTAKVEVLEWVQNEMDSIQMSPMQLGCNYEIAIKNKLKELKEERSDG